MNYQKRLFKHVNKYHPIDWLLKSIERSKNADVTDIKSREDLYNRTEFLVIMADIVLRVSSNEKITGHIPTNKEYTDLMSMYINAHSKVQAKLIQEYGMTALSLITAEQIKFKYPNANLLGRLFKLYSHYEDEIIEATGLSISNIVIILLAIHIYYAKKEHFVFEIQNLSFDTIEALNTENITKFLKYFSTDISGYRTILRDMGFDKRQLYSFRLLERYPIIKFENKYIVPSIDNLIFSITNSMYVHLLGYLSEKNRGRAYQESMGHKFEDYVRLLTGEVFNDIIEAKSLVPKNTLNAEFVVNYDDTAIVVEVKKFVLKKDSAFKDNIDDLDELLKRHIVKAYKQIETTFKYVSQSKKIGLIIIFGDLHMQIAIQDYLKNTYPDEGADYLDNIIIVSIGSYEVLLSNPAEDILEILNSYLIEDRHNKGDVLLMLESLEKKSINPFLEKVYFDTLDDIIDKMERSKNGE